MFRPYQEIYSSNMILYVSRNVDRPQTTLKRLGSVLSSAGRSTQKGQDKRVFVAFKVPDTGKHNRITNLSKHFWIVVDFVDLFEFYFVTFEIFCLFHLAMTLPRGGFSQIVWNVLKFH